MRARVLTLGLIAVACGGRQTSDPASQSTKFALALPDRIEVHASETVVISLVTIGASSAVTFTVSGLPPYATLQGHTIRATPQRGDAPGDTTVAVTATDGSRSDSGTFVLGLVNAAPEWAGTPRIVFRTPGAAGYRFMESYPLESSDAPLLLKTKARIVAAASDADGDPVELVAELRALGESMTGVPTHRADPAQPLQLDLPALELDKHYSLDVWLRDSHGTDGDHVHRADVFRENTPPQACDPGPLLGSSVPGNDGYIGEYSLVLHGPVTAITGFCDVDGDPVRFFAELRPADQPLTGAPTHSLDTALPWIFSDGSFELPLPEVQIGQHYHLAIWLRDTYGAESAPLVQTDFVRDR